MNLLRGTNVQVHEVTHVPVVKAPVSVKDPLEAARTNHVQSISEGPPKTREAISTTVFPSGRLQLPCH